MIRFRVLAMLARKFRAFQPDEGDAHLPGAVQALNIDDINALVMPNQLNAVGGPDGWCKNCSASG